MTLVVAVGWTPDRSEAANPAVHRLHEPGDNVAYLGNRRCIQTGVSLETHLPPPTAGLKGMPRRVLSSHGLGHFGLEADNRQPVDNGLGQILWRARLREQP